MAGRIDAPVALRRGRGPGAPRVAVVGCVLAAGMRRVHQDGETQGEQDADRDERRQLADASRALQGASLLGAGSMMSPTSSARRQLTVGGQGCGADRGSRLQAPVRGAELVAGCALKPAVVALVVDR
jgi:hypothetical protein